MPGSPPPVASCDVTLVVAGARRRAMLTRALEEAGHVVRAAPSPSGRTLPRVVVADWPWPADAAAPWNPEGDTPLIAVIADGDVATAREALAAGAADYVWSKARAAEIAIRVGTAGGRMDPVSAAPRSVSPLHDMLEALPTGMAVVSPGGTVTHVNARMCHIVGGTREDLVGTRAIDATLLGQDAARITALFSRASRHGQAVDTFVVGRSGPVVAHLTASTDDVGRPAAFLLSVRHRNARERVADALARVATAAETRRDDMRMVVAREATGLVGGRGAAVLRAGDDGTRVVTVHGDVPLRVGTVLADNGVGPAGLRGDPGAVSSVLRVGGGVWGTVVVRGARGDAAACQEALDRFCHVAAIALSGADGNVVADGEHDPLTGMLSNRAFFARMQEEFARAQAEHRLLALVLVDLDQFRRVNDNHGHVEGDRVLAEVAERLRSAAAPGHVLGCLGGEEFGWILPATSLEDAFDTARMARQAIAESPFGAVGRVTATMGVSELTASQGESLDELQQQAEVALHWAKISGGNRCVSYSFTLAEQVFARKAALTAEGPSLRGMRALAWAVDARDPHTQRHSIRVADLSVRIAVALGWSTERATHLREAGMVHDVGKIAVPDRILFKPTRLTAEEFALVTRHPVVGAQIVADVLSAEQAAWVRGHHERWDGRGYPDGLAGDAIPEEARVLALADAWDVMTSVRAYKNPVSLEGAVAELLRCSGTQFWPDAVAALLLLIESGAVGVNGVVRPVGDVAAAAQSLVA